MDSLSMLNGEPVQIVKIRDDDHSFFLDEEALERIMSDSEIKDKPVCIVSVAGIEHVNLRRFSYISRFNEAPFAEVFFLFSFLLKL